MQVARAHFSSVPFSRLCDGHLLLNIALGGLEGIVTNSSLKNLSFSDLLSNDPLFDLYPY